METTVLIALISTCGSIVVASLTFYLTKKEKIKMEWQQIKINHYKLLLSAISDLAIDTLDHNEANLKFANASNTIALVAPQKVITALMNFHDEVKFSNKNKSIEKHDQLLKKLLLEIRKDIGISEKDIEKTFTFHLIGSLPKRVKIK